MEDGGRELRMKNKNEDGKGGWRNRTEDENENADEEQGWRTRMENGRWRKRIEDEK